MLENFFHRCFSGWNRNFVRPLNVKSKPDRRPIFEIASQIGLKKSRLPIRMLSNETPDPNFRSLPQKYSCTSGRRSAGTHTWPKAQGNKPRKQQQIWSTCEATSSETVNDAKQLKVQLVTDTMTIQQQMVRDRANTEYVPTVEYRKKGVLNARDLCSISCTAPVGNGQVRLCDMPVSLDGSTTSNSPSCSAANSCIYDSSENTSIIEYKFCLYPGSIIAGASFAAALIGINWSSKGGWPLSRLMEFLGRLLHVEVDYLSNCFQSLEDILSQALDEEANDSEDRGSTTPTDDDHNTSIYSVNMEVKMDTPNSNTPLPTRIILNEISTKTTSVRQRQLIMSVITITTYRNRDHFTALVTSHDDHLLNNSQINALSLRDEKLHLIHRNRRMCSDISIFDYTKYSTCTYRLSKTHVLLSWRNFICTLRSTIASCSATMLSTRAFFQVCNTNKDKSHEKSKKN
ncbi:unnamed protein product [Nesidiocoris tenuis]|uniref:Cyclin C-terminal domain-containing protein n=1 Tax=Nesidiocoris tenuis TaxID=355587 RepID=A0A6H5G5B9_9HEMI|nr:unnamed protein product [Nesidiocoris tenuis]